MNSIAAINDIAAIQETAALEGAAPKGLLLVGLNHRTAPVEVRERLHFSAEDIPTALRQLAHSRMTACTPEMFEAGLLSTCNRTEVYIFGVGVSPEHILPFLAAHAKTTPANLAHHLYQRTGIEAVQHLMRVAAGLDSLVAGEDEILGQVKNAHELARAADTCGAHLSALFRGAIHCGKRARTETEMGCLRRSVATVVVDMALEIFPSLENRTALLVGAGKISAMTARGLTEAGLRCILAANRTYERAVKLAGQFGGRAVHFDALPQVLGDADIVICSTSAPHIVLHADTVQETMRSRAERPLLIVDLAVPRDVDPAIARIANVLLVDIDDLERVAQQHNPLASAARACAETVVNEEVQVFEDWLNRRRNAGLIAALQEKAAAICHEQAEKTAHRLGNLDQDGREALQTMARSVAAQLLHGPMEFIQSNPQAKAAEDLESLMRAVFDLHSQNKIPPR